MTTIPKTLPVTPGGVGAAVATDDLGLKKTIVVTDINGSINIEIGINGEFCVIASVSDPTTDLIVEAVCDEMRVDATNAGAATVTVAAEETESRFTSLPAAGTSIDVSQFGDISSAIYLGDDDVILEISQDGTVWSQVMKNFISPLQCQTECFSAVFARVQKASGGAADQDMQLGTQEGGAGGAGLKGFRNMIFVYREGETNPGGNVYNDMDKLEAAMQAVEGPKVLYWDSSIATCAPPGRPGQPYEMESVSWLGAEDTSFLDINDNVSFVNLREIGGDLVINMNNTVESAVSDLTPAPFTDDLFEFGAGALVGGFFPTIQQGAGAKPFFDLSGGAVPVAGFFRISGRIRGDSPAFDLGASPWSVFFVPTLGARVDGDMLLGTAGEYVWQPNTADVTIGDQSLLAGAKLTFAPNIRWQPRVVPQPPAPASAVALPNFGGLPSSERFEINTHGRFEAGGGGLTQTLPLILFGGGGTLTFGMFVIASNEPTAAGDLTLDAGANGNTINGAATYVVKPGMTVMLISDGISEWKVAGAGYQPTAAYDASGVAATDRTLADGDSLADTISVLGSLIKDLQSKGIVG